MSFSALSFQAVGPKAGTPGTLQDSSPSPASGQPAQQSPGAGSSLIMFAVPLGLMVMMLFMSRNQKKKDAETRSKLKKGDRVVSQSGLVGELVDMDDAIAKVKIAPGTNVQMLIGTLSPYEAKQAAAKSDDKQLKDLKDAKAVAVKK